MNARSVLCFGDSLTWGAPADESQRVSWEDRWTGQLQSLLGAAVHVIEEGLPGRTSCWEDPLSSDRNAARALPMLLETHSPLDLLILMLGTNDIKKRYNLSPFSVAQGVAQLIERSQRFESPPRKILLICPPQLVATDNLESTLTFEDSILKSKDLALHYEYFARKLKVDFFDASTVVRTSVKDGVHWDLESHAPFAEALAPRVRALLEL
jgi:lysophospholipase L1-like esterase